MKSPVRSSVVIALGQTVLLVVGILAVAASNRLAHGLGYPDLRDFLFFLNHGWQLLPVPVVWITMAAGLQLRLATRGASHSAVSLSGIALLVMLMTAIAWETVEPWRSRKPETVPMIEMES